MRNDGGDVSGAFARVFRAFAGVSRRFDGVSEFSEVCRGIAELLHNA